MSHNPAPAAERPRRPWLAIVVSALAGALLGFFLARIVGGSGGWIGTLGEWVGGLAAAAAVIWAVLEARTERRLQRQEADALWEQRAEELVTDAADVELGLWATGVEEIPGAGGGMVRLTKMRGRVENTSSRALVDVSFVDDRLLKPVAIRKVVRARDGSASFEAELQEDAQLTVTRSESGAYKLEAPPTSKLSWTVEGVRFTRIAGDDGDVTWERPQPRRQDRI